MRFVLLIATLISVIAQHSWSQQGRVSESEIRNQEIFIEANKQKLLGRFEDALELLMQLYREDRENDVVAYELAKLHANLNDDEESEKYIKRAIEINSNREFYSRFYIDLLDRGDRRIELEEVLRNTISLFPQQDRYRISLADLFAGSGRYEEAIEVYDGLETEFGIREEISRKKFEWYDHMDDQKNAVKELEKLVQAYPDELRFINNLANYFMQTGNSGKGLELYRKVLSLDPGNSRASLAITSQEAQKLSGSAQQLMLLKPIVENPKIEIDKKVLELIPFVETMGDSSYASEVLQILELLVNTHPNEAKAHAIYADALSKTGNLEQAVEEYENTINLNSSVFLVWDQLLLTLAELQRYDELASHALDAMDYYPNQAICYYYYGLSQFQAQQYHVANEYLSESLILAARDEVLQFRIYFLMARSSLAASDFELALDYAGKARDLSADSHPGIHEFLGDVNFQMLSSGQGELTELSEKQLEFKQQALNSWQKAISLGGDSERIRLKIEQAEILK